MTEPQPPLRLVLVPGTWGSGFLWKRARGPHDSPRWFEHGHRYLEDVKRRLQAANVNFDIHVFSWSEKNSILARYQAALALADYISKSKAENPALVHIIIGHSHAGNIAVKCVSELGKRNDVEKIGIITLATPFLTVFNMSERRERLYATHTGDLMSALIWSAAFSIFIGLSLFAPNLTLVAQASLLAITFVFLYLLMKVIRGKPGSNEGWAYYRVTDIIRVPITALRGTDDEATLAMIGGAIGVKIVRLVLALASPVSKAVIHAVGAFIVVYLAQLYLPALSEPLKFITICGIVGTGLSFALAFVLIVGSSFRCVNGWELFWGGLAVEANVHSTPDHAGRMIVMTVQEGASAPRLRHSLFEYGECSRLSVLGIDRTVAHFGLPRLSFSALAVEE